MFSNFSKACGSILEQFLNYYTVTLKSLTFQFIAILFKLFFLMLLLSWNTLFYYGTKNRLDFPPKLSESNFLAEFFLTKIQTEKIPRKIKPRVCLPLISRLLIWINSRYLQLVMWPHLPGIGRLLSGTYLRRNSLIWNEAHFLSILAKVCHMIAYTW